MTGVPAQFVRRKYVKEAPMWQMVDGRWVSRDVLKDLEERRRGEAARVRQAKAAQLSLFPEVAT